MFGGDDDNASATERSINARHVEGVTVMIK